MSCDIIRFFSFFFALLIVALFFFLSYFLTSFSLTFFLSHFIHEFLLCVLFYFLSRNSSLLTSSHIFSCSYPPLFTFCFLPLLTDVLFKPPSTFSFLFFLLLFFPLLIFPFFFYFLSNLFFSHNFSFLTILLVLSVTYDFQHLPNMIFFIPSPFLSTIHSFIFPP